MWGCGDRETRGSTFTEGEQIADPVGLKLQPDLERTLDVRWRPESRQLLNELALELALAFRGGDRAYGQVNLLVVSPSVHEAYHYAVREKQRHPRRRRGASDNRGTHA